MYICIISYCKRPISIPNQSAWMGHVPLELPGPSFSGEPTSYLCRKRWRAMSSRSHFYIVTRDTVPRHCPGMESLPLPETMTRHVLSILRLHSHKRHRPPRRPGTVNTQVPPPAEATSRELRSAPDDCRQQRHGPLESSGAARIQEGIYSAKRYVCVRYSSANVPSRGWSPRSLRCV